jgi:hypothetical protein
MRKTILKTIKISLGALVFTALLGNSGCLVDTGSDVTDPIPLNQKHVRIYKSGDRIEYDVQIDVNQGTLITTWDQPEEFVDENPWTLQIDPILGLLKETTTLDYEGSGGPVTVVRYITQDAEPSSSTYGKITVHAFLSQSGTSYDYVHESSSLADTPIPVVILPSPLLDDNLQPITDSDFSINYFVFPCDTTANTCSTVNQSFTDTLVRTQTIKENLESSLDYFETIKVPFSSGAATDLNFNELNVRLDIKAWCGDISDQSISFSGAQWFYPSIGIVRYEIICAGSTGAPQIQATVSSVNFPY